MNATTDLRPVFVGMVRSYAPDDDGPSPAADSELGPADDAAGEGDEEESAQDEEVKNPRMKQVSEEAKKYRLQLREAQARIKQLEEGQAAEELKTENAELRLRLEFNDAEGAPLSGPAVMGVLVG